MTKECQRFHSKAGGIIWEDDQRIAYRKRGSMVLDSIQRDKSSVGYVGSDRINEDCYVGFREPIDMVVNEKGQPLRFALVATNALAVRARLSKNEPLTVATSYPLTASRLLGNMNSYTFVPGGVEGELRDREDEFDAGLELVQSGDSLRANGIEIVEDAIEYVTLECVRTPYD